MQLQELRDKYRNQILQIAKNNNVAEVMVFGSVARGDAREDSDVDFLVKMSPDAGGWDIGGFYSDVEELLGKRVDVLEKGGVHKYLKDIIFSEAINL